LFAITHPLSLQVYVVHQHEEGRDDARYLWKLMVIYPTLRTIRSVGERGGQTIGERARNCIIEVI